MNSYKTIIWATDGSRNADVALDEVRKLAGPETRTVVVHCNQLMTGRTGGYPMYLDDEELQEHIRNQVTLLTHEGYDVDLVIHRTIEAPADVIASVAGQIEADLVVVGTTGHRLFVEAFFGSTTHRLLRLSPCPVLAVPPRGRHALPVDDSAEMVSEASVA